MKWLLKLLREPIVESIDIDGEDRIAAHGRMLAKKRMLREVFTEFHHTFHGLENQYFNAQGLKVELGAGVAPIRDSYPDVLATDIVPGKHFDRVIDAENMAFGNGSVRALFGQNCFHHFPHPDRFFSELDRVLAPGGGVILLEPYYGPFATFLFKRLFKTEGFDKDFPTWEVPASGPMNGANQALSYIVFVRDRAEFQTKYPSLKIVHHELCGNFLKYLISGGLNFRQLLPDFLSPVVGALQTIISPFNRWLCLHHIFVVRKVK